MYNYFWRKSGLPEGEFHEYVTEARLGAKAFQYRVYGQV